MKFRHVFIIFGVVIVTCVGGVIARNAVAEAKLLRTLPQYERDLETGALLVEGAEYYIIAQSNFTPVDVEKHPFGVEKDWSGGRGRNFLHWVNEPGGAWIYMDMRVNLSGHGYFVYRRADVEVPTLDEAPIYAVLLSSAVRSFPMQAREPRITPLLQGYVESQDFVDFLRKSDIITRDPWIFPEGECLGSLQLHSLGHPRMAFIYTIYRGPDGKINLNDTNFNYVVLNDEFSAFIEKGLSQ
jgi:hypothetical protein